MASKTFGITLSIWNTAATPSPAYQAILGLTNLTPPTLTAGNPLDSTSHDASGGVRTFIADGTLQWTDCTADVQDLPADAGQLLLVADTGLIEKFQVVKVSDPSNPITFNAEIVSFTLEAQPINGVSMRKLTLKPTGPAA